MLSISGMLGPSSPVTQRPSWYDGSSERVSESEERHFSSTPEAGTMPRPQERKGLQSLLNAAASPEPSSPEEPFRPASYRRSFSEEVAPSSHQSQSPQSRKRKSNDTNEEQTYSSNRNRFATSSSPVPKKKRAPRPQYTKEQEDFIWFCRDDLSMSWRKVVELYNNYWHPFEVEPHIRSESGLQSRYYRILDFPVKIRKKKEPSRPDLGLIPSTNRRYPWMGVIKADILEKNSAERNTRHNAASQRGSWAMREYKEDEDGGKEEGSGSETERIRTESDSTNHSKRSEPKNSQRWSSAEPPETRPQVIPHTSETDSEVEHEREWENSRPSTSSSYSRYDSKSVTGNENSISTRIPSRFTPEGPICLPPLRRYIPHTNMIIYERNGINDDFRKRFREKPRSSYGCRISVTNLCI